MKDYYNGDANQQKEWNNTYMDMHLLRKVIMGSNNRDVQKNWTRVYDWVTHTIQMN